MSLKKIDNNIFRIARDGEKLNLLVHATAMMVMNHAMKSGDCTRALTLVTAMPASYRRTTLVKWFDKYSPIRVVLANNVVGMLKKDEKGYKAFDTVKADAEPFYTIAEKTPEEKPPLDLAGLRKWVEQQAKALEKRADEGKIAESEIVTAKALAKQLRAIKVTHVSADNDAPASGDAPAERPLTDLAAQIKAAA